MIPSYPLASIPQDIPPFKSIAGVEDCFFSYSNLFVNYYDSLYGYPAQMVDTGNAYIMDDYGLSGALIFKTTLSDKDYIEYLYSLRDYHWNLDISYTGEVGSSQLGNYRSSSFNIQLDFNYYPIFATSGGQYPSYNSAQYLAPPARCLLENSMNSRVGTNQMVWVNINSFSGAYEIAPNMTNRYGTNQTYILFNEWLYGTYLWLERVNIWEYEYLPDHGYFIYAQTDEDRAPFNFLGTGLLIQMPIFNVAVPYYDNNTSRYYHDVHRCHFARYYSNTTNTSVNAPWYLTFDGVDYQSYFNVAFSMMNTASLSASITANDSYFNFLDS